MATAKKTTGKSLPKIHVYNAGPLFTEYCNAQRIKEGKAFDKFFATLKGYDAACHNPASLPVNDDQVNKPIWSKDIFDCDNNVIQKSNVLFVDMADEDSGTMVELGMFVQRKLKKEKVHIYAVHSDYRVSDVEESGLEKRLGYNKFALGALTYFDIPVHTSFKSAFKAFQKDIEDGLYK